LEQHLAKMHQDLALSIKAVALAIQFNFSRIVGEIEQHLLPHLLYAATSM
jgi:hypothetical protein